MRGPGDLDDHTGTNDRVWGPQRRVRDLAHQRGGRGGAGGGAPGLQNQLIEDWNGSAWQVAPVPVMSRFSTRLLSVSGTSASDIWAVGDQQTSNTGAYPPEVALIMHWNGSSWTWVPSPDPGAFVNRLVVVKAFGRSDVWASGFFLNADCQVGTDMTLHWGCWQVRISGVPGDPGTDDRVAISAAFHNIGIVASIVT